jgi:polyferredoxin
VHNAPQVRILKPQDSREGSRIFPKLLVLYLAFVLYLYLANWLAYLNLISLPLGDVPTGALLPLVLIGVVAVTLYNSWKKRKKKPSTSTAASKP